MQNFCTGVDANAYAIADANANVNTNANANANDNNDAWVSSIPLIPTSLRQNKKMNSFSSGNSKLRVFIMEDIIEDLTD